MTKKNSYTTKENPGLVLLTAKNAHIKMIITVSTNHSRIEC